MMKALAFHFRKGTTLKFALKKDEHVRHMDYFNIITYKDNSEPVE
jgi:hypothetical protein